MNQITLYGVKSENFEALKNILRLADDLDAQVNEVNDTKAFIANKINRIPAISINGEIIEIGTSQPIEAFTTSIQTRLSNLIQNRPMKKILVATDFSENSKDAIKYAIALGKMLNYSVQIVHIFKPSLSRIDTTSYLNENLEKKARKQLQDLTNEELLSNPKMADNISSSFLSGFAADKLIQLSKKEETTLLILGNSGTSERAKHVFGSLTVKVSQQAHCPVLIIPPCARFTSLQNVIYSTNDNVLDSAFVQSFISLLGENKPHVHLLNVGLKDNYDITVLTELWKKFYPAHLIKSTQIPLENVVQTVLEYSSAKDADLLIVSKKNRGFIENLFHRSISTSFVIKSSTPILLYHEGDNASNF